MISVMTMFAMIPMIPMSVMSMMILKSMTVEVILMALMVVLIIMAVMVSMGISIRGGAWRPHFIEKNITISAGMYREIIDNYCMPNILFSGVSLASVKFQIDNAPSPSDAPS